MKHLIAIVASAFALSAFAADAPKATKAPEAAKPAAAPAKVEAKKDAKPAKSQAPAVKDTKATAPATK